MWVVRSLGLRLGRPDVDCHELVPKERLRPRNIRYNIASIQWVYEDIVVPEDLRELFTSSDNYTIDLVKGIRIAPTHCEFDKDRIWVYSTTWSKLLSMCTSSTSSQTEKEINICPSSNLSTLPLYLRYATKNVHSLETLCPSWDSGALSVATAGSSLKNSRSLWNLFNLRKMIRTTT
ncbi:hypothetical protein PMAYCL1PPCAC_13741 [Pristionchus mayeri]|uniref:Uncharacterized protein n=1 Tax=Pristionchus mayeri TaxID=1317129 RepID=A0AAN4ZMR6_9BILA|nr:hypothetical protein PMAYCL1PPCAC_13741 [Pristionchus mayeri]